MSLIQQKLWDGYIHIRVVLDSPKNGDEGPIELVLSVRRLSYFPLYFEEIAQFFARYCPEIIDLPLWLEYDGAPVQWHLPVGLLYDLLYFPRTVPCWTVKLHCSEYPRQFILPFQSVDYKAHLKLVVMNLLKQSCFVLNGSSRLIMNLNREKSDQLWGAIVQHNWVVHKDINQEIIPITSKIQRIPIKMYLSGTSTMIQSPVYPELLDGGGGANTLQDVVEASFPQSLIDKSSIIIQGISLDDLLTASPSIVELWSLFKHLDNFLHVTIRPKEQE